MPVEFTPEPDDSDNEEFVEDAVQEPPVEVARAPPLRMRGKQAPRAFASADDEFRVRFLGSLHTWLQQQRTATAASVMRYLRRQRDFPVFARNHPFYAKAANIVARFEGMAIVPGGSTAHPRIRSKDVPAPEAERGEVVPPGEAPKGPPRGQSQGGLGAALRKKPCLK